VQELENRNAPQEGAETANASPDAASSPASPSPGPGAEKGGGSGEAALPSGDAYHVPVMVDQVLAAFQPAGEGTLVDGTAGGGGHAEALLRTYPELELVAVDRDPEAMAALEARLAPFAGRVRRIHARFDRAAQALVEEGASVDGVLLDLGISSRQIDHDPRGFTFRDDAPLDARMGMAGSEDSVTAATLLNSWPEADLAHLFRRLAEEPRARRLAAAIVAHREETGPLQVAGDLNRIVDAVYRRPTLARERAPLYQALRIQVNAEMEALDAALPLYRDLLRPGGVFAVLSYHSLEDRRVKNAFREWSRRCICPPELPLCQCRGEALGWLVNRSVLRPTDEEVEANPRARSARFRIWRKAA
jgi:16S rRNA (cytosine1402-N4)-methyltransferase